MYIINELSIFKSSVELTLIAFSEHNTSGSGRTNFTINEIYYRVVRSFAPGAHYFKYCNYVSKSFHCRALSCSFHRVSRCLCRRVSSRSCSRVVSFLRENSFR